MAFITMTTKSISVTESVEQLMKEIKESDFKFIPVTEVYTNYFTEIKKEPKKTYTTVMINIEKIVDVRD